MNLTRALLTYAQLSSAAYSVEPQAIRAAIEPIGFAFLGLIGNGECWAVLSRDAGGVVVTFRGTQFIDNTNFRQILDNVQILPRWIDGGEVMSGYWDSLAALIPMIEKELNGESVQAVTGHSMGGIRAELSRHFWPNTECISFGAPKGADWRFWRVHGSGIVRVVRRADFAPNHPPFIYDQPNDELWIHQRSDKLVIQEVLHRTGINESEPDHSDTGYVSDLVALDLTAPAIAA